jgi:hypothetical protein
MKGYPPLDGDLGSRSPLGDIDGVGDDKVGVGGNGEAEADKEGARAVHSAGTAADVNADVNVCVGVLGVYVDMGREGRGTMLGWGIDTT